MKDFYFIYTVIGVPYIKMLIKSFDFMPPGYNVIVLTSTPELFDNLNLKINLTVLDLNEISDNESKINEPIIKETDHDLFIEKVKENFNKGIVYPYGKHRFVIPWLIERGITKFAILDSDCILNYNNNHAFIMDQLEQKCKNKNTLISLPMDFETDINVIWDNFGNIFEKYNIQENSVKKYGNKIKLNDGWLRGFYFKDINFLKLYFNLWNEILIKSYDINFSLLKFATWTVADEWIHGILSYIFKDLYDIDTIDFVAEHERIAKHVYHPENDYFVLHHNHLYSQMYKLETTESRIDFFNKNKEKLEYFYSKQNGIEKDRLKDIIYDWPF